MSFSLSDSTSEVVTAWNRPSRASLRRNPEDGGRQSAPTCLSLLIPIQTGSHPVWPGVHQIDLVWKSPQDSVEGVGTISHGIGVNRWRVGLLAVLVPVIAGCSLPNTGAEPTALAAAAATPVSTPVVLDAPGVKQTAEAAFSRLPGGT